MLNMEMSGIYVALVTPFNDDYSVDYDAFEKLVEFQLENGIHKFVVCGSTGEGTLLNNEERRKLTILCKNIVGERGIVGIGCSSGSTNEAVSLVSLAQTCHADFVLVAPPYYVKPTQNGIVDFYTEISKSTDIPIIAYNIPGRVSVNMQLETLLKISRIQNVIGVKEAATRFDVISQLSSINNKFIILSGDDLTFPASLVYGTRGTISAIANYCPKLVCDLFRLWKEGHTALLTDSVHNLETINRGVSVSTNPIPLKYLLMTMGLIKNILRPPLSALTASQAALVDTIISGIK